MKATSKIMAIMAQKKLFQQTHQRRAMTNKMLNATTATRWDTSSPNARPKEGIKKDNILPDVMKTITVTQTTAETTIGITVDTTSQ
jgi:hypothetical protein